jgi:tetratricopeptide (TPR) repeat protein
LRIKILGKTDQIKGRAFERLMSILLDYMGYTDFRPGIHYTGMEVDLKGEAKHKVKQESILCECKAHERPIGSEPLTDFFGKLSIKRSAIRYLDSIIENEGDLNLLKMAWNNKGLCLLRLKRCEDAIPYFEKVITHDPTHLQALTNLAHCLDSVGRSEEANDVKDELQKLKRKQAIT